MVAIADLEHCSYTLHENGIHEFTINRPTRRAVDELFAHITTKLNHIPADETIRELVDLSAGVPPIAYMAHLGRDAINMSNSPKLRVAFLYQQSTMMMLLKTLVDLIQPGALWIKPFRAQQREEAIEWLLKDTR
jgi:hypothetical protein